MEEEAITEEECTAEVCITQMGQFGRKQGWQQCYKGGRPITL